MTHQCEPEYVGRRVVKQPLDGRGRWKGVVDIFRLTGHPRATLCYGWQNNGGIILVLNVPPIASPEEAVKAGH
jgi:hypothetical protein